MKTESRILVIALAMLATLTIGSSMAFGQNKDEQGNDLVGVWEEVAPATVDCVTRQPNGPVVNVLYTFNQGGTMYVEDTLPVDRNRTIGGGIWKRTSGRNYVYVNSHYSFDSDKKFLSTIKQRSNVKLSQDGNSFTENGTFEAVAPNGAVLFSGCFTATAHRMTF